MANIRFNVGGKNATMNPADKAMASGQVPPAAANSTWFLKNLSQYNRPPSNFAGPNRMDYAAQLQAEAIERARKAQADRLEAQRQQMMPTEEPPLDLFGRPM